MTVHFSSASISNLFLAAITTEDGIFGSVYNDIIWNALELSMWSMLSLNKENLYHFIFEEIIHISFVLIFSNVQKTQVKV